MKKKKGKGGKLACISTYIFMLDSPFSSFVLLSILKTVLQGSPLLSLLMKLDSQSLYTLSNATQLMVQWQFIWTTVSKISKTKDLDAAFISHLMTT